MNRPTTDHILPGPTPVTLPKCHIKRQQRYGGSQGGGPASSMGVAAEGGAR